MNKIDKLELKHLCVFLPHEVYAIIDGVCTKVMPYHLGMHLKHIERGQDFKLCLLPLSALTEPLEDGTIPAIVVAKTIANIHNDNMDDKWVIKDDGRILIKTPWDLRIEIFYKTDTICFAVYDTWNHCEKRTIDQCKAFEYLYSKHFDIYGLIPAGLAIDKRTVNQ